MQTSKARGASLSTTSLAGLGVALVAIGGLVWIGLEGMRDGGPNDGRDDGADRVAAVGEDAGETDAVETADVAPGSTSQDAAAPADDSARRATATPSGGSAGLTPGLAALRGVPADLQPGAPPPGTAVGTSVGTATGARAGGSAGAGTGSATTAPAPSASSTEQRVTVVVNGGGSVPSGTTTALLQDGRDAQAQDDLPVALQCPGGGGDEYRRFIPFAADGTPSPGAVAEAGALIDMAGACDAEIVVIGVTTGGGNALQRGIVKLERAQNFIEAAAKSGLDTSNLTATAAASADEGAVERDGVELLLTERTDS
ncbi:MAG: hypothetical protein AAF899_10340 [Pseudomonadota bacterium]